MLRGGSAFAALSALPALPTLSGEFFKKGTLLSSAGRAVGSRGFDLGLKECLRVDRRAHWFIQRCRQERRQVFVQRRQFQRGRCREDQAAAAARQGLRAVERSLVCQNQAGLPRSWSGRLQFGGVYPKLSSRS